MSRILAGIALSSLLTAHCSSRPAPPTDPWPAHAQAISDSISNTLIAYGERFHAADADSIERFYVDDPHWRWAADGRVGSSSGLMIKSRLEGFRAYPRWNLTYENMSLIPLGPGIASVTAEYRMRFSGGRLKPLEYGGALTAFWEHRPGGWKIIGGHSSTLAAVR